MYSLAMLETLALTNSDIIAFCSMVVALCGIAISIWQGWLMRKHNRLSTKPILNVKIATVLDGDFGIFIKNTGLGPAIIDEVKWFYKGKWEVAENSDQYKRLWVYLFADLALAHTCEANLLDENTALMPGEKMGLLFLKGLKGDEISLSESVRKKFSEFDIHIRYKTIYGEILTTSKK